MQPTLTLGKETPYYHEEGEDRTGLMTIPEKPEWWMRLPAPWPAAIPYAWGILTILLTLMGRLRIIGDKAGTSIMNRGSRHA